MPPPTDPGMQDKNSKPEILFSIENSDRFLSNTLLPATNLFLSSVDILLKFFPSLIVTPSKSLSENKVLDPAPNRKIFPLLL